MGPASKGFAIHRGPMRHLYADFGLDYQSYALGALSDRCFTIPLRK